MSSPYVNVFSLGSDNPHLTTKVKNFKGEKGGVYRLSLIYWPGTDAAKPDLNAPEPCFLGAPTHYIPKAGYVVNNGPEYTALAGKPPRTRIGTLAVAWPLLGRDGTLDKARFDAGEYTLLAWVFGYDKLKNLRDIHKDFHLGMHDLKVSCTETTYQKLDITACRESLIQRLIKDGKTDVLNKIYAEAARTSPKLGEEIGREMSIEKVKELMFGRPADLAKAAPQQSRVAPSVSVSDDTFADL